MIIGGRGRVDEVERSCREANLREIGEGEGRGRPTDGVDMSVVATTSVTSTRRAVKEDMVMRKV
jgi:hypothetical protein